MRSTVLALAVGAALVLGACSADQADFKKQTENYLKGSTVAESVGIAFKQAQCAAPTSTKVGTTYSCVATAVDGTTWDFAVEVASKTSYKVTDYKQRSG